MKFKSKLITSPYFSKYKTVLNIAMGLLFPTIFILWFFVSRGDIVLGLGSNYSLAAIMFIFIILFINFKVKQHKNRGVIEITEDHIITIEKGIGQKIYDVAAIKAIKIIQDSYVGRDSKFNPSVRYKGNNWIEFEMEEELIKKEFTINSEKSNKQLAAIKDRWIEKGIKVDYQVI